MTSKDVGTIIQGTHRLEDLLPRFVNEAKYMLAEKGRDTFWEIFDRFHSLDPLSWDRGKDIIAQGKVEDAQFLLDDLFDLLNDLAPEGYYFGAHPGDGSDFGYWTLEEE
tara:strand:- start:108 stop:434 length:327 start_codon:yes stop_codon:yes gene_type:complete